MLTYVGAYDDKQITAALRRELLREGQVFDIDNRVESIERAAARLRDLVPEARIQVAHGQMSEDLLERVIVGFWEKEFDVLVCTTIESGIDIANASTSVRPAGGHLRSLQAATAAEAGSAAVANARTPTSSIRRSR